MKCANKEAAATWASFVAKQLVVFRHVYVQELRRRVSTRGSVAGAAPVRGVIFASLEVLAVLRGKNTWLMQGRGQEKNGSDHQTGTGTRLDAEIIITCGVGGVCLCGRGRQRDREEPKA